MINKISDKPSLVIRHPITAKIEFPSTNLKVRYYRLAVSCFGQKLAYIFGVFGCSIIKVSLLLELHGVNQAVYKILAYN